MDAVVRNKVLLTLKRARGENYYSHFIDEKDSTCWKKLLSIDERDALPLERKIKDVLTLECVHLY